MVATETTNVFATSACFCPVSMARSTHCRKFCEDAFMSVVYHSSILLYTALGRVDRVDSSKVGRVIGSSLAKTNRFLVVRNRRARFCVPLFLWHVPIETLAFWTRKYGCYLSVSACVATIHVLTANNDE